MNIIFFILLFFSLISIVFNYKNIIVILASIELALLSINLNFIYSSVLFNDSRGIIFSIVILTVAAAEAAIGLALLILFYRVRSSIVINNKYFLRG
jgi:NADH:ubiquinone oxidoreductase subunit K